MFRKVNFLEIRRKHINTRPPCPPRIRKLLYPAHVNLLVLRASFQDAKTGFGPIYGRDMSPALGEKHRVSARAASQIECPARRQERQELAQNLCRLGLRSFRRKPMLLIPLCLARRHKKGS
jgi:hypothetical protein